MVETQKKVEELKKTYLSWSLHDSDVRREGKREGYEQAKLDDARNMLLENISEDVIARCTGLPLEKVQQLARFAEAQSTD